MIIYGIQLLYDHIWDTTPVRPYMGYNLCATIYGIQLLYNHTYMGYNSCTTIYEMQLLYDHIWDTTPVRPYMGYNLCTTIYRIQLMYDHIWNTTHVRPYMGYNSCTTIYGIQHQGEGVIRKTRNHYRSMSLLLPTSSIVIPLALVQTINLRCCHLNFLFSQTQGGE